MNLHLADKVAQAVLYEGYLLYPYRPDTAKNRRRWTFGGLFPPAYCQAHGGDPSQLQTECLVLGSAATALDLRLRCLHLQARLVGQLEQPLERLPKGALPPYRLVETLRLGEETYTAWQEAVEREVVWPGLSLEELLVQPRRMAFSFPAAESVDPLWLPSGAATGVLVRRQPAVQGAVEIRAAGLGGGVFRLTVSASNLTPLEDSAAVTRDEAALWSLASTHLLLGAHAGEFVSLIDPPEPYAALAADCQQTGVWPVLVGTPGERDLLLAAPIILYDYPEIAPESPGDLFDGTEIDEILTLRILTLTEPEKQAMRAADARGRALLDRTEALPAERLSQLHGAMRNVNPPRRNHG